MPSHICEAYCQQHFHHCLVQTPPNINSQTFTPNRPPVLRQQLTADYLMSQHAWDEITTKLNEMAKENRLIKQAVCKT